MMEKEDMEKRKIAFASVKERLVAKYPDKVDLINTKFTEVLSDGCSGCKSRRIMAELFSQLGEPLPLVSMQQIPSHIMAMQSGAPRPPCEDCFKEHIGKAVVLLTEAGLGYPEHRWLAIANLGEASAEILGINPELANEVRGIKLRMVQDKSFVPDLMKYLK